MVEHLYVRRDVQRAGIGSALLEVERVAVLAGSGCGSSNATTAHARSTRDTDSPKSDSPTAPTTRSTNPTSSSHGPDGRSAKPRCADTLEGAATISCSSREAGSYVK